MTKILYVDDELESRVMVAAHLRYRGYAVYTVEKAPHALRTAAEDPPDIIILDVNLIGMDGPELMELLQESCPGAPIILYTGMNKEDEKVRRMLAAGASDYVSKNTPLDALTTAVCNVLKSKAPMAG